MTRVWDAVAYAAMAAVDACDRLMPRKGNHRG